jgi:NADH-quinone oxidoreductase subunit J
VDNLHYMHIILCVLACVFSTMVLLARTPLVAALSLLGVLLSTGFLYGLIQEHFIATIQLVVYAGAIMVLFIFSIMLLNLKAEIKELSWTQPMSLLGLVLGLSLMSLIVSSLIKDFNLSSPRKMGFFTTETVQQLGGNSKVLAHALFSNFYISFEVISIALLTALVGAVVLAKRKFD